MLCTRLSHTPHVSGLKCMVSITKFCFVQKYGKIILHKITLYMISISLWQYLVARRLQTFLSNNIYLFCIVTMFTSLFKITNIQTNEMEYIARIDRYNQKLGDIKYLCPIIQNEQFLKR